MRLARTSLATTDLTSYSRWKIALIDESYEYRKHTLYATDGRIPVFKARRIPFNIYK